MAYLFKPDGRELNAVGLGAFATVPFVLSDQFVYLDEANRFLRQRATGEWHPKGGTRSAFARRRALSENSIQAYGSDLENALSFLERCGSDWRHAGEADIRAYHDAMTEGAWSADGAGLVPSTVNRRVDTLRNFLTWALEKGLRSEPADAAGTSVAPAPTEGNGPPRTPRRRHPDKLKLPRTEEIDAWLREVETRCGATLALACKCIIKTGMRLEENVLVRVDQLPPLDEGRPASARMEICYGTKGGRHPGDPEKKGKSRTLRFAPTFHAALVDYRQLVRPIALMRFRENNKGAPLPKMLFLSERTGLPFSPATLYQAWHNCRSLPFDGFSPHIGRHVFACQTLLSLLEKEFKLVERSIEVLPKSMLMEHARNLIDVHLRPAMGHVSSATTDMYLGWLDDHLYVRRDFGSWASFIDAEA